MALVELRNVSKIYHLGGEEIRALDDVITDYVTASVTAAGGNVRKAARQLQISPSTLYARMKKPA